jgi:hypothetical protein
MICDFERGFVPPEMVKVRPVVVISRTSTHENGLCTIVPLSTTPPQRAKSWHVQLKRDPTPYLNSGQQVWAKCDMHSLRHMLRTQQYVNLPVSRLVWTCLSPMLGVSVLVALGWLYLPASSFDSRILQFVFVTLAALTVPHMLLVDRARYSS